MIFLEFQKYVIKSYVAQRLWRQTIDSSLYLWYLWKWHGEVRHLFSLSLHRRLLVETNSEAVLALAVLLQKRFFDVRFFKEIMIIHSGRYFLKMDREGVFSVHDGRRFIVITPNGDDDRRQQFISVAARAGATEEEFRKAIKKVRESVSALRYWYCCLVGDFRRVCRKLREALRELNRLTFNWE